MGNRVLAAISCFIILFAASVSYAADTFNLAVPLPLTGGQAKFGEIMKRSFEIAADEINAKGGIKGMKVKLDFQDSQGKPETARAIVEKIIDVQKQQIVVGEYTSACAKAVAAVAEERKIPYIVVSSAADDITQKNYKYVFRINSASAYYDDGLLSFFKEIVKPKSIAIIYESSDFGTAGADNMEKSAKQAGMSVSLKEKYEKGAVDFKPILSKVKAAKPDVIYMISYVMDASLLMKQIKELRIDAKLFAGGAAGFAIPEFIQNSRDAAEYVVTATLWHHKLPFPGAKEYAEKYKAKYKDYPSYHGALAYSSLYVVKDAVERSKSMKSEDLRTALRATDMKTTAGPVKFQDKNGYQNQNFADTYVLQVQKGDHEVIWPAQVATKKYLFPIPTWRDRR